MFGNIIYLIVALLIYYTYQPPEKTGLHLAGCLLLFILINIFFTLITYAQFRKLKKSIFKESLFSLDQKFNRCLTRQSVLAVVIFAMDIYILNLPGFLSDIWIFKTLPTLLALIFILLFVSYLAIVWAFAHGAACKIYENKISKQSYIISNISFSAPMIFPWLLLSALTDIIGILPFKGLKDILATPGGEAVYFLIFLTAITLTGPAVIQKLWRCKPLEPGYHRNRIECLCKKAGVEYAEILYWPIFGGRIITAGVMGLIKKFRYILITKSLLLYLQPEEIDAVISHEIGHVKKKHLVFYLLFLMGYMVFSYALFDIIVYSIIHSKIAYWFINHTGVERSDGISIIIGIVTILFFLLYFRFIFGYFMRNFERQADTYVYALSPSALPMISTFKKIAATSGKPAGKPNWHHFSIKERIDFLKKCETDRTWISRHDKKVKTSLVIYAASIIIMGCIGYSMHFSKTGKNISMHSLEKIILQEIEKTPNNAELFSLLGNLYYDAGNFADTIKAYEASLAIEPDNPDILNNLAWLLATCEDKSFFNPERSLNLAKKAASLNQAPHIMDTLAESLYVNGRIKKAVSIERQALNSAKENRPYYKDRLEKFIREAGE